MSRLSRTLEPIIRPLIVCYSRFAGGKTLGVRAVVINGSDQVLLVKHTYVSGWFLPGGGVEVGESVLSALARKLTEDGNIQLTNIPRPFGAYLNQRFSLRDHIILFVVREFRQEEPPRANHEILAHGFFSPDALPVDTSKETRARIAEVLGNRPVDQFW